MDWQQIINFGLGTVLTVIGWFARQLWEAVQKLKEDVSGLELHMAENYVKKAELDSLKNDMDKRFDKLEQMIGRLFDRLDSKVDK
jgi:cell shape-determining protein MreC